MTTLHHVRGDVAVLVPAAGLGIRLGVGGPKALHHLRDAPLLVHALRRLVEAPSVGHVVVAAPAAHVPAVVELLAAAGFHSSGSGPPVTVVGGGHVRQDSVRAALAATPPDFPIVLVHDAARAFAPASLFERVADAVRGGHDAVIPVLAVVDTVKRVGDDGFVSSTLSRTELRAVQTPQGFARMVLEAAHAAAGDALTDDAGLVERIGVKVFCVDGAIEAMKITRPLDLLVAEAILAAEAAEASEAAEAAEAAEASEAAEAAEAADRTPPPGSDR